MRVKIKQKERGKERKKERKKYCSDNTPLRTATLSRVHLMAIPYCYKETHISCRNRKPFSSYFSWSHTLGHPSPFITGPIHAHTHTSVSAREFIFDKHLPMIKSRPSMAHSGGMCPTVLLCVIQRTLYEGLCVLYVMECLSSGVYDQTA